MADNHIDYDEVSEYGRYFWAEAARLVGATSLADIEALRKLVLAEVEAMEAGVAKARLQKSGLRTGRGSTSEAAAELGDGLRRFYYHLKTVPADVVIDRAAFFPAGTLGAIDRLKPADLLARGDEVLAGFSAPANAKLPGAADWRASISSARDALQQAIEGKRDARSETTDAVDSLAAIRLRFLNVYNNVAKRLVHAVLAHLGRLDEYRRFFLDLQVSEDRTVAEPALPPEQPGAQPGAGPVAPAV